MSDGCRWAMSRENLEVIVEEKQDFANGAKECFFVAPWQIYPTNTSGEERIASKHALRGIVDEAHTTLGMPRSMQNAQWRHAAGRRDDGCIVGHAVDRLNRFDGKRQGPDGMLHRVGQPIEIGVMYNDPSACCLLERSAVGRMIPVRMGQQDVRDPHAQAFGLGQDLLRRLVWGVDHIRRACVG